MLEHDDFSTQFTLVEAMTYDGKAYRAFFEADVPAGTPENPGTANYSIINGPNAVHLFYRRFFSNYPDVRYEVRAGATITGYSGGPVPIFNMKYNGPASDNVARQCTVSDIGQLVDLEITAGTIAVGNRPSGGTLDSPDDLKILPPNTEFLIHLINPNAEPVKTMVYLKWFETNP